jgi:hypothetical protein
MSHRDVRELHPRSAALDCSVQHISFIHINGRPVVSFVELWASRGFPSDLGTSGIAPGSLPAGFGPGGLGTGDIAPGESLPQRYGPDGLLRSLLPSGIPDGIPGHGNSLPAGFGLGGLGAGGIVSVVWAPAVSLRSFGPAGQIVSDPAIPHPSGTPSSIIGKTPPSPQHTPT